MELYALGELEFFMLYKQMEQLFPLVEQAGYHATAPYAKSVDVLNEMLRYITQITGNVKYAHHEVGSILCVESDLPELSGKAAEQVEIEFLPTPICDAADALVLSRWIIRNTAYRHNYSATFVPKLEIDHAGNGMHIHMALMKDGKNAMTKPNGKLSDDAMKVIGGLCKYAQSLTAFGNTVAASYLRLVPHQEAPTKVCWSEMNRHAMIRVPLGWTSVNNLAMKLNPQQTTILENIPCRQTVEIRSPDGSANVHLLLAGIALAAEWGISNGDEARKNR